MIGMPDLNVHSQNKAIAVVYNLQSKMIGMPDLNVHSQNKAIATVYNLPS